MRLKDRVAIVTGAGGVIGRVISTRLAEEGATVVAVDINLETVEETVKLIAKDGGAGVALKVDVTKKAEIRAMAQTVLETYGQIDILVNNAGMDHKEPIVEYDEDWWDRVFALNVKGLFLCTQAVLPTMMERRYGRIVNIASMAGKTGEPFTSAYCASKSAVIGFTQVLGIEGGPHNITGNAVCPGPVEGDLIWQSARQAAEHKGVTAQQFMDEYFIGPTPMGRLAKPRDVADAVLFLSSDEAGFITGTTLNVSGGREMH
jgi:NAD(P)-dependent dehydrogenase (short-subunit alcohol dehydrogenase family)